MKRVILIFSLFLFACFCFAQRYVVTSITGQVHFDDKSGAKKELRLRQILTPNMKLTLPYKAQVELLELEKQKQYQLKVSGYATVGEMITYRQNSVMQLTKQYLAYMKARIKSNGEMTSRRYSDPASVTREVAVKKKSAAEEYMAFRQQAKSDYESFRQQAISEYASFMRKAWQSFEASPEIPFPQEKNVPPVEAPRKDIREEVMDSPVKMDGNPIVAINPHVQPAPAVAIKEQEEKEGEYVEFTLYGTSFRVRFTAKEQFKLNDLRKETVADVFERLQSADFNNTIRDCLELRTRHQLCDWSYVNMLDAFSKACFSTPNESTLLMAFIYQQSGYKMRLGVSDGNLVMLYSSNHVIFGHSYFVIDNERFYPFGCQPKRMSVCEAAYPKEKSLSLWISQPPMLTEDRSETRVLKSAAYKDLEVGISVNRNLLTLYNDYPSSKVDADEVSRWAIYANMELEPGLSGTLLPFFREKLNGLDEKESVERLLNWVQTAFEYEYDDKVWGHDRAFFVDETLFYPYADCEDRSILLSRLVRDLLGLPTILVYYPEHLAMAVGFTNDVPGDYIMLNGKRFVVCDPTFINAQVGRTMPGMNNGSAKVILLSPNS